MPNASDEFLGEGVASANGLTEREVEVLSLVASGKRNREIAAELAISTNTVDRHVSSILKKMGVSNRAQAAAHAVQRGLVA